MKLFIDTSNSILVFSLINSDDNVEDFIAYKVNKNATVISIDLLKAFMKKNKFSFVDIDTYYFIIGPGSFTGIRIVLNILGSINLVYKNLNFYTISSFDFFKEKNKKFVYVPFGKNKFYLKKYSFFKRNFKIVKNIEKKNKNLSVVAYKNFNENKLEYLIKNKKFKKLKSLDKVKLIYGVK
ncbi:MAG: hypothetical protein HPAVJP_1960 [Candidatus Hepatoplasma vulgare]|nr:MAG: hypothetical protein HPAVJP_1960 [Candidatus Hepatoplasma sp.]